MRSWRVWLGLIVSLVFIFFALRGQDIGSVKRSLRGADYSWIIPGIGLYFLGVGVRAYRWQVLLRSVSAVSAPKLFPIVVIGFMANNILPLRAGELVRSYALSARHGIKKSAALATIAVERLFDGMTMLIFMLVASMSIALTSQLQTVALIAGVLFPVLLLILTAFVLLPSFRERMIDLSVRFLPGRVGQRVDDMAHSFFEGLGILKRRRDLLTVAVASLLAWLLEAGMYLLIAQGFDLDISALAVLMVTAVANLATLIPSSPGYVGPFETGALLVLNGALQIPRELALSYAIVVHAALYFPVTVLGMVFWWRESLSWSSIRREAEAAAEDRRVDDEEQA